MNVTAVIISYIIYFLFGCYKDFWTWPGNVSFRGNKKISCTLFCLLWTTSIGIVLWATLVQGESLTVITGKIQILLNIWVLLLIKNGFSHYARYETYWMISWGIIFIVIKMLHLPFHMFQEMRDYIDLKIVFLNYVYTSMGLLICHFLWKRKVLHWIPQEFCTCFFIVGLVFMVTSPDGIFDVYMTNIQFSIIQVEIIACTIMVLILIWGIMRSERARMYRLKYFYDYFYQYTAQLQRKMGILHHDFANYQQVLGQLSRKEGEGEVFIEKLENMYQEVKLPKITGFVEGDRFFAVYLALAENLGYHIEICWEAEKQEIDERFMMQCMETLCTPFRKRYSVFCVREKKGKVYICKKRTVKI